LLNTEEIKRGADRLASSPLQMNIEMTGRCNVFPPCVFCSGKSQGYSYNPLSPSYLQQYQQFLDRAIHINDCSFGEPLTHPEFCEVARRFTGNGQIFSFATNGLLLRGDKARALAKCGLKLAMNISLNAATSETYEKLCGCDFNTVVENIRGFVQISKEECGLPYIVLSFIVMQCTKNEVADFLHLAKDLECAALLAPLHDRSSSPRDDFGYRFVYKDELLSYNDLMVIGAESRRLAEEIGLRLILQWDAVGDDLGVLAEEGSATPCLYPWRFLLVKEHLGEVFGCCYHTRPIGSVADSSLQEIWNNETQLVIRRDFAKGVVPPFCWKNSVGCPLLLQTRYAETGGAGSFGAALVEDRIVVGENDSWHLLTGWFELEGDAPAFRWTSREARFRIRRPQGTVLSLECIVHDRASEDHVVGFVECAGVKELLLDIEPRRLLVVRGSNQYDGDDDLVACRIVIENPRRPADIGVNSDQRRLGIAVTKIWSELPAASSSIVSG